MEAMVVEKVGEQQGGQNAPGDGTASSHTLAKGETPTLTFDHQEENNVESIGQMQAFKSREYTKLEQFYIDVDNVYANKEDDDEDVDAKTGTTAGGEDKKQRVHFLQRMNEYLERSRIQVENIKQLISFTMNRQLTLRPAAPPILEPVAPSKSKTWGSQAATTLIKDPKQHLLKTRAMVIGKRRHLENVGATLAAHATRLKNIVQRGNAFARKLYDLSQFWSLQLQNTGGSKYGYDLWVPYGYNTYQRCQVTLEKNKKDGEKENEVEMSSSSSSLDGKRKGVKTTPTTPTTPNTPTSPSGNTMQPPIHLNLSGLRLRKGEDLDAMPRLLNAQREIIQEIVYGVLIDAAARVDSFNFLATTAPDEIMIELPAQPCIRIKWPEGPSRPFMIEGIPEALSKGLSLLATRFVCELYAMPSASQMISSSPSKQRPSYNKSSRSGDNDSSSTGISPINGVGGEIAWGIIRKTQAVSDIFQEIIDVVTHHRNVQQIREIITKLLLSDDQATCNRNSSISSSSNGDSPPSSSSSSRQMKQRLRVRVSRVGSPKCTSITLEEVQHLGRSSISSSSNERGLDEAGDTVAGTTTAIVAEGGAGVHTSCIQITIRGSSIEIIGKGGIDTSKFRKQYGISQQQQEHKQSTEVVANGCKESNEATFREGIHQRRPIWSSGGPFCPLEAGRKVKCANFDHLVQILQASFACNS
eukprot:jgi/Bigna1/76853/fgenesh1_pg.44_\